MSNTELKCLNRKHKAFLVMGLLVICTAIGLSWNWSTDLNAQEHIRYYLAGVNIFLIPPLMVVVVMAISLHEVFILVKLRGGI